MAAKETYLNEMLKLVPLEFKPNPPVLGQAIPFKAEGRGYGILYGPPWLSRTERVHSLRAKRFGKAVVFRKTPVSKFRPRFPFLKRRPRLVKAGETIWIVANKPKTKVRLKSLWSFKNFSFNINPKGVVAHAPGVFLIPHSVKPMVRYRSRPEQAKLKCHQLKVQPHQFESCHSFNYDFQKELLILKNTSLSTQEIYKLTQQNK